MTKITFSIDDTKKILLEREAINSHLTVDELINTALDFYLTEKQRKFEEARKYVRGKYKELYKRLA